jgi:prepilin-type N-terminal cleavage/methylation domain-containing protein
MEQRKTAGHPRNNRLVDTTGFTLIELTVVIVILSVVALLVIPRLPFAHEGDLRTSARSLAGTLRYLEDLAISSKQYYRLRINLVDGTMKVTRVLPETEETEVTDGILTNLALREGVGFADITTSQTGKISEGETYLDFSPLGSEEFLLFHLKSVDEKRFFTVALYPGSGRVEVSEGYLEGTLSGTDQEKNFSLEEKEDAR